jgi:hypothetical protein
MKVVYSDDPVPEGTMCVFPGTTKLVPNSIFLAGPTPRDAETPSWRPEALKILANLGFDGTVFVPEWKNKNPEIERNYLDQVEWEWEALHKSDTIVFWVPREIEKMPAFTTNVEFGFYLGENDALVLYGRPEWAAKKGYLDWLYTKLTNRQPHTDLTELLMHAMGLPAMVLPY